MTLSIHPGPGNPHWQVFRLKGSLDEATHRLLRTQSRDWLEEPARFYALDCSELTFIGSSGFRVLLQFHHELESRQGRLVLYGLQDSLRSAMTAMGVDQVLRVRDSESDALEAVKP